MATTTNYSWTTPDDTALVKDGAAAIRSLGSSVDTTVKNLNPETTLGDLAYRSSTANVKTRLGLGTAGQVLTVNSGATAPEWAAVSANSLTLLSTTSLSGSSVTVSSISGSYTNLLVLIFDLILSADGVAVLLKYNGSTASDYGTACAATSGTGSPATIASADSATSFTIGKAGAATSGRRTMRGQYNIPLYSSTTYKKSINGLFFGTDNNGVPYGGYAVGNYNDTAAVSSLTFLPASGTFTSGTALTYGVK